MSKTDKDNHVLPLQQSNDHNVPKKQWKRWSDLAQRVFNNTYESMLPNQRLFLHPKTKPVGDDQWSTTAWNAAWIAADAVMIALKDIEKGKGYLKKK